MLNKLSLSIVVPVYNEVQNVAPLYAEIVQALASQQLKFEVIFVDDGSTDATLNELLHLAEVNGNLQVLAHKKNRGQSAALLTGVKHAQHPYIITMDGDGQNDPNDILLLLANLTNDHCVVLGNRRQRRDNLLRRLSSRIANATRRLVLQDACTDTGCSLKLFSRHAFMTLPHFNHMHRYLPTLFNSAGYNLVNVAVNHRPRKHGASKYGISNRLWAGIYDLIGVRWLLKRRFNPLVQENG